jgi:hypothetical protein
MSHCNTGPGKIGMTRLGRTVFLRDNTGSTLCYIVYVKPTKATCSEIQEYFIACEHVSKFVLLKF